MLKTNAISLLILVWISSYSVLSHEWRGMEKFTEADIEVKFNHQTINTTVTVTEHVKNVSITVAVDGQIFTLDLLLNSNLFPEKYQEMIITADGHSIVDVDIIGGHCYYTGSVQGYPNSIAAVSTCEGIVGFFVVRNETYYIEPLERSFDCVSCKHNVHKGFPDKDFLKNIKRGTAHTHTFTSRTRRSTTNEWPQDLNPQTKIVELYTVMTHAEYVRYNSSIDLVTRRAKTLVNMASAIFQPLDIYVVLVGLEVWTIFDKITIDVSNANQTLENFYQYSLTNINVPRDVTQLITSGQLFNSDINGNGFSANSYVGQMCTPWSVHVIVDISPLPGIVASDMSQAIGVNFGLNSDDAYDNITCACNGPSDNHCIMWSNVVTPTTYWSKCSIANLTTNLPYINQFCLRNMPTSVFDAASVCGNGLIEAGEQCDCGNAPASECNRNCCHNTTCKLIGTAQCAFGRCCSISMCKFKQSFTVCRPNATSCDLSEYCSGTDYLCPTDVYKIDYTNCMDNNSVSGFCSSGLCPTRRSQCQAVWGPKVGEASNGCYSKVNIKGVLGGNCGLLLPNNYNFFKACTPQNALCGLLLCNGSAETLIDSRNYQSVKEFAATYSNGTKDRCISVLYSSDNMSGMVPNGATCGNDMACLNQVCTQVSDITTVTCPNCNCRGICNSLGQCHCDVGFAPPDCSLPGNGGSLHSNGIVYLDLANTSSALTSVSPTSCITTSTQTMTTTTSTPTGISGAFSPSAIQNFASKQDSMAVFSFISVVVFAALTTVL